MPVSVKLGHTDVFPDATTPAPNLPQKLPTKPLMIVILPRKFSGAPIHTASTSSTMASGSPLAPPGHSQTIVPARTITAHSHSASNPNDIPTLGFVMVSYLDSCTFLICVLHCLFFPLGLASYTEDCYTFTLGPCSFSLAPVPEGKPTPVPILLFTS